MTDPLRLLDTGLQPARGNVALSAALLDAVEAGCVRETIRFHRYARSVVIGRNQDIAAEVDLDACERQEVELARRFTGGGAVVMGPGVLAWDLALRIPPGGFAALGRVLTDAVVAALARLGATATRATPGSVESGGLKLSGSAGRAGKRAFLHQATLVLDLRDAAPLALLRRRTEGGRPTADPEHRMTSLAQVLGRAPPLAAVQSALTASFAEALGREIDPAPSRASDAEHASAEDLLASELGRDDHVLGDADRSRAA